MRSNSNLTRLAAHEILGSRLNFENKLETRVATLECRKVLVVALNYELHASK